MSDRQLASLASEAGLAIDWTDAFGKKQRVSPDTLRAVLGSLGYLSGNANAIRESRKRLRATSPTRAKQDNSGKAKSYFPHEPDARYWGIAVQLYSLRGGKSRGFGDFAALTTFVKDVARAGADAVAISPVHASVPGRHANYSPYSPSTRFFLDPLFAPVPSGTPTLDRAKLIDWQAASNAKLHALDAAYRKFRKDERERNAFEHFVRVGGTRLLDHARFEALHVRFANKGSWHTWPAQYRDAHSVAVRALNSRDPEIERHLYFQWLAARGLADAQAAAKKAGMRIGIIADLAVGMDPAGSHVWSAPKEVLRGVSIGAPPDLLAHEGQNWGLAALSPTGLRSGKFAGFIATLRANMTHAGGIRIDHAMGLKRIWLVPDGAKATEGVYLSYPFREMMAALVRESRRCKTIVIAEDLGTVPEGFREALAAAGILGMRVLPFERDSDGHFIASDRWERNACALSATHDLAPLAGWWRARDIDWRSRLWKDYPEDHVRGEREKERKLLWQAFKRSGAAQGLPPGIRDAQDAVDAAIAFVAKARSKLALFPIEDIAGLIEQPNLPGTTNEHPNWRRRLPEDNGLGTRARKRLAFIERERR